MIGDKDFPKADAQKFDLLYFTKMPFYKGEVIMSLSTIPYGRVGREEGASNLQKLIFPYYVSQGDLDVAHNKIGSWETILPK